MSTFLFVLMLAVSVSVTAVSLHEIKCDLSDKTEHGNMKNIRAASRGAAILLSMFVSSAYLAHEAVYHHNCSGEDCPVCEFIAQIVELRRSLGMMLLALLLVCISLAVRRAWREQDGMAMPVLGTLVSRKIRLNN